MSETSFFLDRYQAEVPIRIHSRDTDAGGNPAFAHAFESWLTDGEGIWRTAVIESQDFCVHPTGEKPCPTCEDTGLRVRIRHTFRHPAKRALEKLDDVAVRSGRPRLGVTLRCLADNDGNFGLTIAALATQYSYMWNPRKGYGWITHALREFERTYVEDSPARLIRGISDSQADAEACIPA